MSLELTLHTIPDVPLEAAVISPDKLAGLKESEILNLPLHYGNRAVSVGDFFQVSGPGDIDMRIIGDLSRVKHLGADMSRGRMTIEGNVGLHLGACMSGGEILVEGDTDDWVAPEMSGGRIRITGNAGHMVGSAYRGCTVGMRDGEIYVMGNCGNEAGNAMRGGLIAIGGNSGDFTGVNMLAGTIIVLGELGIRSGAGMKRGSIVSMNNAALLPTFSFSCSYRPAYLRVYLEKLREEGFPVTDAHFNSAYNRWCGDAVELNRGETLLRQD